MSLDVNAHAPLEIPSTRRRSTWTWLLIWGLVFGGPYWLWTSGFRPSRLWAKQGPALDYVRVDQGDLDVYVTENGALESGNNATVYCRVEALLGQVGGAQGGMAGGAAGGRAGGQGGAAGGGPAGTNGQAGQGQGQGGQNAQQQQPAKAAMPKGRPGSRTQAARPGASKSSISAANGTAAAGGTAQPAAGAAGGAGGGAAGAAGGAGGMAGAGGGAAASPVAQRPVIRSFTYQVAKHVPLRPVAKTPAQAQPKQQPVDPGGGGGRGRRGGGNNMMQEKPGATRIISILPEGSRVKAGDVVCEFDSSTFNDEVKAQKIRYLQAEAWVKQAKALLEVSEISLREYRDGIYPQDAQLIRQYITTCKIELDRAKSNYEWSKDVFAKGYRAQAQLKADGLAVQQAEINYRDAERMAERLEKYTKPKLIKALEAKVEAIRADEFAQRASFQLESDRLKRLEKMVENCTLRAPRDGIVVYVNQTNGWGRVEAQIQEGTTVREGQPIFSVPDPELMQVKAKVNESKVAQVHRGQPARVRVDAFPDRILRGTVGEVTAIPAPAGIMSDVKLYFATVKIDKGFSGLRPGLSAEVDFFVETRTQVTRIPIQAVRTVAGQTFAALQRPAPPKEGPSWQWVRIVLGPSSFTHAEVVSGLKPGDRVVADPNSLPAPQPAAALQTAFQPGS